MLRKTQIELPLISDYDIYMKFEQNIRGGVSFIGHIGRVQSLTKLRELVFQNFEF